MIYVTGDTHGGQAGCMIKLQSKKWKEGKKLTKKDYLIVCGDFGLVWLPDDSGDSYAQKQQRHYKQWLTDKPWTTLFVDGNHESHYLLGKLELVDMFGSKVGKVNDSIFHLKRGEIYNIEGNNIFTMGGALSTDIENRTLGISYWKEEVPSYAEMDHALESLEKANWEVDYVITHNCPEKIGYRFISEHNAQGLYNTKVKDPTANFLQYVYEKLKFKNWYYGHWHEDWNYDKFTLLYDKVIKLGDKA